MANIKGKLTLERLLTHVADEVLIDINEELMTGVIPATGAAHLLCRTINKKIDAGTMCINESTLRKVYLPTLAKAIHKEMASRYSRLIQGRPTVTNSTKQLRMWEI